MIFSFLKLVGLEPAVHKNIGLAFFVRYYFILPGQDEVNQRETYSIYSFKGYKRFKLKKNTTGPDEVTPVEA